MKREEVIAKIKSQSKFPWSCMTYPNGLIRIVDANNVEVPIFALAEFAVTMTELIASNKVESGEVKSETT